MDLSGWGDRWFRTLLPPLVVAQVVVLLAWGTFEMTGAGSRPRLGAAVAPTASVLLAAQSAEANGAAHDRAPRDSLVLVAGGRTRVGAIRIGMDVAQAQDVLGERLVEVQRAGGGSGRFEVVAPTAGLRLAGARSRIDTITVTNIGGGPRYRTARGVSVGDDAGAVPRAYPYAIRVCGHEWWVTSGRFTLRFASAARVTSITLTSRRAPQFVDCF